MYSIDTDIVHLYIDPAGTIDGKQDLHWHYTHIFEGDSEELSIALAKRVTEFIFFGLADQAPILLLPPIQREVIRVFFGIAAAAGNEQERVTKELDQLRDSLEKLVPVLDGATSDDERLDRLLACLPTLRTFLFGFGGPSMQLARLSDLLERSTLADLDALTASSSILDATEQAALSLPSTVGDLINYSVLEEAWQDRLTEMKGRATPRQNIVSDCEVLAKLEMVNDAAPKKLRLVHVTGDQAIFRAAQRYFSGTDDYPGRLWLRDPRAFLAEPGVLFGDAGTEPIHDEVAAWLDVLLGSFTDGWGRLPSNLEALLANPDAPGRQLVKQVLIEKPNAVTEFESRWDDFCDVIALDVAKASRDKGTPIERFRLALEEFGGDINIEQGTDSDVFGDVEKLITDLEQLVDERVQSTWQSCFDTAAKVGFTLLRSGAERSRYAPPIVLAEFSSASRFFDDMLKDEPSEDDQRVVSSFEKDDPYVVYLVFAALFGARGKWHPARLLAERALTNVTPGKPRETADGSISGREAHFLRAICRRLTARNTDDLDDAERSLDAARAALKLDSGGGNNFTVTALRFDAEAIALRVARCLFARFIDDRADWADSLGEWRGDIKDLLGRIEGELEGDRLQARVRVALEVNYLMAQILSDAASPEPIEKDAAVLKEDVDMLKSLRRTTRRMGNVGGGTYLVSSVLLAATAALDPPADQDSRGQLRTKVERHFQASRIGANRTTIYDSQRFLFLRDFAMARLEGA